MSKKRVQESAAGTSPPKRSIKPRYAQVKDYVVNLIDSGEISTSDRIPSENELSSLLGISRMTINRGINELAEEGILVRIPGVGTFVNDQRVHAHPLEIRNVAEDIRSRGHHYDNRVVTVESVRADEYLAEAFAISPRAPLYHSLIVHLENQIPLQLEDRYVLPAAAPDYIKSDFSSETPYDVLMRIAPLHQAEHTVRAILPDQKIRKLLEISQREACLFITRRTWSGGRIASLARLYYPGSRFELSGKAQPT